MRLAERSERRRDPFCPSARSPAQQTASARIGLPCHSGGRNGSGGALPQHEPAGRLLPAAWRGSRGRQRRTAARRAKRMDDQPDRTSGPTGWSRNSNDVTTPKLPPPPRIAQNRSGLLACAGRHHARRPPSRSSADEQIVDRQAVAAAQPAEPAAQRQAGDPGRGVDAERRRESVRLGRRDRNRRAWRRARPAPPRRLGST